MAIDVRVNKTMFGKRTGGYTAFCGEFTGEGKTATEAKAALLSAVETYKPSRYVIGAVGATFIITRGLNGQMEYAICGPGRSYACGCLMNTTDSKEGIERAREHARQSFGGIVFEHSF